MEKYTFDWKISKQAHQTSSKTVLAQLDNGNIDIYEFGENTNIDRVAAKARLISAAPDLLKALQTLNQYMSLEEGDATDQEGKDIRNMVDKAIAKVNV